MKRKVIGPNYGFVQQLLQFDEKLFGKKSISIEEYVAHDMAELYEIEGDISWILEEAKKCNSNWNQLSQIIANRLHKC